MIKKLFGLSPNPTADGGYIPSKLALKLSVSKKTDYTPFHFANPNKDNQLRILVLCTEQSHLKTKNGNLFSTGNHPVETLVPMLHLKNAGFDFDIFTPTGKPTKIEMWAMPAKDQHVMAIYEEYKDRFEKPGSIAEFVSGNFTSDRKFVAVFIPGGHGALLGLPRDKHVGDLIRWAFHHDLFTLAICHGPAALLSAKPSNDNEAFIYQGYQLAAFPESVDSLLPLIGYLPGKLTWSFGAQLKKLGMTFVNSKADDSCFADRKLITGASPKAANAFGKLCATKLLEYLRSNS